MIAELCQLSIYLLGICLILRFKGIVEMGYIVEIRYMYRMFIKYCEFSELCQFFAALVFYLPGGCTHTDTQGKQRAARVRNLLKFSEKNTIFNKHPVPPAASVSQVDGPEI